MQLLEDRDDVADQVLVHDQLSAVRLPVETDVVDLDSPQPVWSDGATRPPTRAEFGCGDRTDGRRCSTASSSRQTVTAVTIVAG